MRKEVTITLDSGCFLPKEGTHCEIGYFQCGASVPDIKVKVDGHPLQDPHPTKLGVGSCILQIHHKDAAGKTKTDGITIPVPFHDQLLHLHDLYGSHVAVSRKDFDCILRFESGELSGVNPRKRKFKRVKKEDSGALAATPEETKEVKEIVHDIRVRYTLGDDESIVLTRNGTEIWSISKFKTLEITIDADDVTTEGFYRRCFQAQKDSYWLPNPDDPPPFCPVPPCPEGG